MMFVVGLIILGAAAVAVLVPDQRLLGSLAPGDAVGIAMYGSLGLAVAAGVIARFRGRIFAGLLSALAWVGIFAVIMAGYTYRDTFGLIADRMLSEIMPGTVSVPAPGEAVVTRRMDGQFVVDMRANDVRLPFIFDTGASTVVVRAEDAARIGINVDTLRYTSSVATANGRALAADAMLASLAVGDIKLENVRALVAKPGALRENLLGQTFLERLTSYGVENNRLVLRVAAPSGGR